MVLTVALPGAAVGEVVTVGRGVGVVTAIVQGWLVGKIAPRMGERTLIVTGALTLSLGLGALTGASGAALTPALAATAVVASLVVTGIGWGLVGPGIAGYISRHTPPERQGRALGILHGVASSARIVGPPGFGLLASLGGLFATDLASKKAAGATMGFIGVFSYLAAGAQERVSARLIQDGITWVDGVRHYDFGSAIVFWIGGSVVSLLLASTLWRTRPAD